MVLLNLIGCIGLKAGDILYKYPSANFNKGFMIFNIVFVIWIIIFVTGLAGSLFWSDEPKAARGAFFLIKTSLTAITIMAIVSVFIK